MDDDGTNAVRLTKQGARQAAYSPDGKRMAFVRPSLEKINGQLPRQIYIGDADGNNGKMLTKNPYHLGEPCWSADGAKIFFLKVIDKMGGRANIFEMDADGSNPRRLTAGPTHDRRPSLSPDGSKLAFQSNRAGNYEIYVMNLR